MVERTSLEVITNTHVATTLASIALENNHPFLDATNSFLGNGRAISTSSKRTHLRIF
jgi:hypothetical protein